MNLIRAALFAVFAFMGSLSLSAQQNWLPPAQAIVVLNDQLAQLQSEPPTPVNGNGGSITKQQVIEARAKSGLGCSDCQVRAVKEAFITLTLLRIKSGMDTGDAVEEVRALMIGGAGNNATMLSTIQSVYLYMQNIL